MDSKQGEKTEDQNVGWKAATVYFLSQNGSQITAFTPAQSQIHEVETLEATNVKAAKHIWDTTWRGVGGFSLNMSSGHVRIMVHIWGNMSEECGRGGSY